VINDWHIPTICNILIIHVTQSSHRISLKSLLISSLVSVSHTGGLKFGLFGLNCWKKTPSALTVHCTHLLIMLCFLSLIVCCLCCVRIGQSNCVWKSLLLRYVKTFSKAEIFPLRSSNFYSKLIPNNSVKFVKFNTELIPKNLLPFHCQPYWTLKVNSVDPMVTTNYSVLTSHDCTYCTLHTVLCTVNASNYHWSLWN